MNASVFIVIPCFNEDTRIERVLDSIEPYQHTIILVDDGSTIPVKSFLKKRNRLVILRHELNLGQGAALETGMEYARRNQADFVIHFDADGQHPQDMIPVLLNEIMKNDVDVILCSRFINPALNSSMPTKRKYLLKFAILFNFCLTGLKLTDAHNGLRILNAKALKAISLKENRMAHATEILFQIKKHQLRFKEIETHITYTAETMQKGQKSVDAIGVALDIIKRRILK